MTRRNLTTFVTKAVDRPRHARGGRHPRFAEHELVSLVSQLDLGDGRALPAGALGAIVFVHGGGEAYEVEFIEPFHAVATILAPNLSQAS